MISTCLVKRSSVLVLLILFFITVTSISLEIAHAQSQGAGIKTDRAIYPEPSLPVLPAAGGKFSDPVFGTQIMRVTDATDCPQPGCGTWYSQWPTFNADNTRILFRKGVNGGVVIRAFDPVNFTLGTILRTSPTLPGGVSLEWQGATWSRTDPDLIFVHVNYYSPNYSATGMKLYTYRPSTNAFALLKDFAPQLAPGQPDYLFEMHIAQDGKDDIFTFMQNRVGSSSNPMYFIVWKRSTNTVLQHITNDATFDANAAIPDKSGRWIYFPLNKTQADLSRHKILDLQTNTWQTVYWTGADDAQSHGDVGTATTVGRGNFSGGANFRYLSNVHSSMILFDNKDTNGLLDWTNDQHMTLFADDENWVTMGLYDDPSETGTETGAFENEVMQVAMDGSQRIRRLFHHRTQIDNLTETTGYWAIPKPTISKDGRFIAFTSNWEKSGRYDLFIAKIDPPGASPTPTPSAIPTPTPTPVPTPVPVTSSVAFVRVDETTQGSWKSVYGADGYNTINDWTSYPSYAQVNASSNISYVWNASTSEQRGLQKVATSDRLAATWYSSSFFIIDVNITDGAAHQLAMYCLDWDSTVRSQTVDVVDASSNALLDTRSVTSFNGGKYLVWDIRGHVRINVTRTGGESAVVSGLYFSAANLATPTPSLTPSPTPTPTATPTATPTPTPTPTPNPTPTPTPTPVSASLAMVAAASTRAAGLIGSPSATAAQIAPLVSDISQAYSAFLVDLNKFNSTNEIDRELRASLYFARAAEALAVIQGPDIGIQNRMQIVAYHLVRAKNLMSSGVVVESVQSAHAFAVGGTPVIGPAEALSSASFAPVLAPASLGTILGDPNQSPLATQTTYATLSAAGELPYELSGVSVAVGGRAAPLVAVSPSRILFFVPANAVVGEAEVIVTLQEGYVSRGTTTIAALAPGIFTVNANGIGDALVMNAATMVSGAFSINTPENLGADKQTRLLIMASGISNGASNANTGNDVLLGTKLFANLAESITVEARTSSGRIHQLPVEFAGVSGQGYGVDQVNVCLIPELKGAGTVELTIIVAGHRSNGAMIKVN